MISASPALLDLDAANADLCPTCQHPLVAHDATGLRWCAATKLGVGRRDCICAEVVASTRIFTHY